MLEEARVHPEHICADTPDTALLLEIWKNLESESPTISEFRKRMEFYSHKCNLTLLIEQKFHSSERRVVIHGFSYITPIQEWIFQMLEKADFELIFLNAYNSSYSYANDIWRTTYSERWGYSKDWMDELKKKTLPNPLGECMDSAPVLGKSTITVTEYRNIIDFIRGIKNEIRTDKKNRPQYYAADADYANEILQSFYPELYGKRTLLSYPIGRFIYTLHNLWDDESDCINLSIRALEECFASGWIPCGNTYSNDYLEDFEKVSLFFRGCSTLEEWENRLSELWYVYSDVISHFEPEPSILDNQRWERILGNPFTNFSMFSIGRSRLKNVRDMILKVVNMVKVLFGTKEKIPLREHALQIIDFLKKDMILNEEQKDEFALLNEFIDDLKNSPYESSFLPQDLSNAIKIYLSTEIETKNEVEKEKAFVKPLYALYGIELENTRIHICLADNDNLPGPRKEYKWPLTKNIVDQVIADYGEATLMPYLNYVNEKVPENNRLMLYMAGFNHYTTISWISRIDEKPKLPSPYIRILNSIYGVPVQHTYTKQFTATDIGKYSPQCPACNLADLSQCPSIPEVEIELSMCHRKYLYGYILDNNPTYTSDFHTSLAIGGLIYAMVGLFNEKARSEIERRVLSLFPFLRPIECAQIKDFVRRKVIGGRTEYRNCTYPESRMCIHYPPMLDEIIGKLISASDSRNNVNILKGTNELKICIYCPHSSYCSEAHYKIDGENND